MTLSGSELKFLLRLLGADNYRAAINTLKPNAKTSASERDRICMVLCSKGLVDYTYDVSKFAIAPAGRTLLNLDTTSLPVTPLELWTLQACRSQTISPGQINRKVPVSDRQRVIRQLEERGLITVKQTVIKEVWLTGQGQQFLRDDYEATGHTAIATGQLLNYYVQFLRKTLGRPSASSEASAPQDILKLIQTLDQQLGTDNYVPIFHLREKLEPPLTRSEVDTQLYDLQRQDKIELSTLQDVSAYSETQLAAGIPQDMGGALFFVSVN